MPPSYEEGIGSGYIFLPQILDPIGLSTLKRMFALSYSYSFTCPRVSIITTVFDHSVLSMVKIFFLLTAWNILLDLTAFT